MNIRRTATLMAAVLTLAACGGDDVPDADMMEGMDAEQMPMGDMEGMEGMGSMMSGGMMNQMRAHMAAMEGAGADSLAAMIPRHRQMLANMIAQMNREMRDMNMGGDGGWDATVDSLRTDLRTMPEMTPAEMLAMMDAHHARIARLMEMHRSMMGQMPM